MVKHIISLLAIFFISHSGLASHLLGGEITWECDKSIGQTNSGKFRFTVIIYRECGGIDFNDANVILQGGPTGPIVCNRVSPGVNVSPICYSGQIICSAPSGEGRMEEHTFRSNWITLTGTPPPTGWVFNWQQCCRPGGPGGGGLTNNSNSTSQSYYLRAVMYPYSPSGPGGPALNVNTCYDSSPQFAEKPKSIICTGYPYTFSHNAYEPEFDSVYYSWADPLGSSGVALPYTGGYSVTNPFPNKGNPVGFTPTSGLVTIDPDVAGSFMSCIKVESYRCNQKISEIYRDIALVIKAGCENAQGPLGPEPNLPPTLVLDSIPGSSNQVVVPVKTWSGYGTDTLYLANVYPGDIVKFTLTASDPQQTPLFVQQNVSFSANSAQIYNSAIPNSCANPPCAYVTPVAPATSLSNFLTLNVAFEWEIACNHLSMANSCGVGSNSYIFPLKMLDNACPAPAISAATIVINVLPSIPSRPRVDSSCVEYNSSNGSVNLNWQKPRDTGQAFLGYIIFHGNGLASPFVALDTIWDSYYGTSYIHNGTNPRPLSNNLWRPPFTTGGNSYYFRTIGSCGYESANSDTISLMELNLSASPPANPYVAQLSWNPPSSATNHMYQIWRKNGSSGSSQWVLIDSTSSLTYLDTVDFCLNQASYQIKIGGACESTVDSTILGKADNYQLLSIDSVSVNGTDLLLSWSWTGPFEDVAEYYILDGSYNYLDTLFPPLSFPLVLNNFTPQTDVSHFSIMSSDTCGFNSQYSITHNNMLLTENMDPCEGYMRLRWNRYNGWTDGVKEYQIWRTQTPLLGGVSQDQLIGTNSPLDTFFVDKTLTGGFSYCFKIRAIDGSTAKTSTSNSICINSLAVQRSRLLYLAKASVQNDEAVDLVAFTDGEADVKHFDIQRADDQNAAFTSLGLIPKPTSSPYEIRFKDFSADPYTHRYQYRLVATDSCGGIDTASNIATNILLQVKTKDNLTNILTWNPYHDFMGGVLHYDIYRKIGLSGTIERIGTTLDTMFTDNVRPLGDNVGIFCYYVKATEGPSAFMFVDYDGSVFTSSSNWVCAEHLPRVFIPNSFNPFSDYDENKVWRPSNLYVEDGTYRLEIFDRWGSTVFSTTDINEGWDGMLNPPEPHPMGTYVYQLNFRSKQGEPIEMLGTLLLIY